MKVALALSGGVDSSLSAFLLKEQGFDVTAIFMNLWARNEAEKNRISNDKEHAKKVAKKIGIEFIDLDFSKEMEDKIVSYFVDTYKKGNSPNPCIKCNQEIKFGLFFDWAMENNFDYVASGHYAQIEKQENNYYLKKGNDQQKDQSYFLYKLSEAQLAKTIFPIGHFEKTEVRKLAKKYNIGTHDKKDSFDVCFLNNTSARKFIEDKIGKKEGNIIDQKGNIIGTHQGIWLYTIGQRQGLKIDHKKLKNSSIKFEKENAPALFVIAKNKDKNQLIVGKKEDCYLDEFKVNEVSIINSEIKKKLEKEELLVEVKVRNTGKFIKATIKKEADQIKIKSKEKVFALAGGQSVVFYQKDIVIGGGIII